MVLKRPGGAHIHWEARGEGPLVVIATQFFGYPSVFEGLIAELLTDHRVVTYDARGTGESSRQGPYDIPTDVEDLGAVIEAAGAPAVVVGLGEGVNRGVWLAFQRPHLVTAVVTPGGNPIGREAAAGTDALVDSPSVLKAIVGLMETDFRAALRTIVSSSNPQLDEEQARDRVDGVVAYCPQEVATARLRAWIGDEPLDEARMLRDRLWILILADGSNPWFPAEAATRTRALLPDAHVEAIEEGPLSRPDITAATIRRITEKSRDFAKRNPGSS